MTLSKSVLKNDRLALARLLTQVENDTPDGRAALAELFPHTGKAHLLGVTGAPGTGKSSLVNQLALHFRGEGKRVAILAVDPSSPFTGGAVLGDRVRMRDLAGDAGVFIRSMATRGSLGGLAQATAAMAQVFDAAGFDVVIIETVGAGQSEVDIARLAHTTIVVEAPGMGDDIQAIKAGILEIADVLVVNKADRPGVENTERALRSMLELAHPTRRVFLHHGRVETLHCNVSTGNVSTGNVSTGNVSTGNVSTGNVSTGNVSTGNVSTGNVSTGNVSTGNVSTGNVSTGNVSTGNVSTGNVSTGNVSTGNVSTGNVSTGNVSTTTTETKMWIPPIQRTVATEGTGIAELAAAIAKHAEHLRLSGDWAVRERARLESEMEALLLEALLARFRAEVPNGNFESALQKVYERSLSPWEAAQMLVNGRRK